MGVNRSDWIVIGVNIGAEYHKDEWYEMDDCPLEKYEENKNPGEITYIFDGMSGRYFVVGEVIQCDPEGYNGLKMFEESKMEDKDYFAAVERVKIHIKDNFGIDTEPELIVFTHWN